MKSLDLKRFHLDVQRALNSEEVGDDLVTVARQAHEAELRLASLGSLSECCYDVSLDELTAFLRRARTTPSLALAYAQLVRES